MLLVSEWCGYKNRLGGCYFIFLLLCAKNSGREICASSTYRFSGYTTSVIHLVLKIIVNLTLGQLLRRSNICCTLLMKNSIHDNHHGCNVPPNCSLARYINYIRSTMMLCILCMVVASSPTFLGSILPMPEV